MLSLWALVTCLSYSLISSANIDHIFSESTLAVDERFVRKSWLNIFRLGLTFGTGEPSLE